MIATTIEQSKHLLELGLDPKTADMHYVRKVTDFMGNRIENPKWSVSKYGSPNSKHASYIVQNFTDFEILPAWSLSALLEVMPEMIKSDDTQYYFHLEKSVQYNWHFISYYFDDVDELYELKTTKQYENPITAAYEMVCWLLENGYIKKGGQDGRD